MKTLNRPILATALMLAMTPNFLWSQNLLPDGIRAMLDQYKTSADSDLLAKAIAQTRLISNTNTIETIKTRLALLKALSSYYDPAYDTIPPPQVQATVMPPVGYDSGVSPDLIKDVQQRADYEKRISENVLNARKRKVQQAIRDVLAETSTLVAKLSEEENRILKMDSLLNGVSQQLANHLSKEVAERKAAANKTLHPTGGAAVPKDTKK